MAQSFPSRASDGTPGLRSLLLVGAVLLAVMMWPTRVAAAPRVERTPTAVHVDLGNGTTLSFALHDGYLLGLRQARTDGMDLKSPDTVVRPVLAEEWPRDRRFFEFFRLTDVRVAGDAVELHADLLATGDDDAYRAFFMYTADTDRAAGEGITPALKALQVKRDAAQKAIEPSMSEHKEWKKWTDEQAADEARIAADQDKDGKRAQAVAARSRRMAEQRPRVIEEVAASKPELASSLADLLAYQAALHARGMELGKIHRDYYEFANLRLPAETCAVTYLKEQIGRRAPNAAPAGALVWRLTPQSRVIAGWRWVGWSSQYEFSLLNERRINVLRQVGTWELDGKAPGLTLVNFRYRGIGGIEHTIAGRDGKATLTFTTTEMLPGAAGKGPAVSPVTPDAEGSAFTDRGYAMRHRNGAWIGRLARGAGVGFVDFQHRPEAILISTFERMDNVRALTEVFPGDAQVSQTDEYWFPLASSARTPPQLYLTLKPAQPLATHEIRTRWQEVDQHFREVVGRELGYVHREVEPGVGMNIDSNFGPNVAGLAGRIAEFEALGVKSVFVHHPGWQNGRDREPGQTVGGGDCSINDWRPLTKAREPWQSVTREMARRGMTYHVWVTGMNWRASPFHQEVGADLKNWAINAPGMKDSSGYPPWHDNLNPLAPRCRELFLGRLAEVRRDYGFQGIWYDSFQNLFMSTLDWANGTGAPLIRPWWEIIAAWSREGIAMTSESHGFPGNSCSIESDTNPEDTYWYYQHTFRWYRTDFPDPGTPRADAFAFRRMANKSWAGPQVQYGKKAEASIPSFGRLAREYSAALPWMRRSYILPDHGGVLWLHYADNQQGVWFPFADQPAPAGVEAAYVLDGVAAGGAVKGHMTYKVHAGDLLKAFGVRAGTEADERLGRTYTAPGQVWPEWARK